MVPELPEVETLRRTLEPALLGRTIVEARVHRRDMIVAKGDPPGGWSRSGDQRTTRRLTGAMMLVGGRVDRIERLGKRLALIARDGRTIEIHLGMTGQVLVITKGARIVQSDHVHVRWRLDSGDRLIFRDPRRFGGLWIHQSERALHEDSWSRIGPDALGINARELRSRAGTSERTIKAVLLDQRVLCGVGNIYADEALFRAQISPRSISAKLNSDDWRRLARAVRDVLARAIEARGTTLRDYRDARGNAGEGMAALRVYGRGGLPCTRCGMGLLCSVIAQRTTTWCPRCQVLVR